MGRSSLARITAKLFEPFLCQSNVAYRKRDLARLLRDAVPQRLQGTDLFLFRELVKSSRVLDRRMFHGSPEREAILLGRSAHLT